MSMRHDAAESQPGGADGAATGDQAADEEVAALDELADKPVDEHPAVFDRIHRRLHERLTADRDTDDTDTA